jgi:hypothetical protein
MKEIIEIYMYGMRCRIYVGGKKRMTYTTHNIITIGVFLIPVFTLVYFGIKMLYKEYLEKKKKEKTLKERLEILEDKISLISKTVDDLYDEFVFLDKEAKQTNETLKETSIRSRATSADLTLIQDEQTTLKTIIVRIADDLEKVKEDTKFILEVT